MRVKAVIAYHGAYFQGFQKQTTTPKTITTAIERALASLQIDSVIVGSGRTDAGVHATGQVIHFDLPPFWHNMAKLTYHLNSKLTHITVKHISPVSEQFHARFSAKKRLYRYCFKTIQPSLFEQQHIAYYAPFDPVRLRQALKAFEGVNDFKYFHKTGSQVHSTVREIYSTHYCQRTGYHFIYFQANGFLRSQVRMMIEGAMAYATGELSYTALAEQIAGERRYTHRLAPPEGLYLARVLY